MSNECEGCDGSGYTYHDYADHNGEHHQSQHRCPDCNGGKPDDWEDEDDDWWDEDY